MAEAKPSKPTDRASTGESQVQSDSNNKIGVPNVATSQDVNEEDEEDERLNLDQLQGFADMVQRVPDDPSSSRSKIVIPKRGEKDFEPLQETARLQEMVLHRSREALFGAMQGTRGGSSKAMSHAVVCPGSIYPRVLVSRGHLMDSMGISIRRVDKKGKAKTQMELLPEEALYLLERGSLQIWSVPYLEQENADGPGFLMGEWDDAEHGVKGGVEMSVSEGFAVYIGRDGLTWERYQAFAYLKRLGYTVHRSRRFIPDHFLATTSPQFNGPGKADLTANQLPPFRTWWLSIPSWTTQLVSFAAAFVTNTLRPLRRVCAGVMHVNDRSSKSVIYDSWHGSTYASLLAKLRIVPSSHSQPLPRPVASSDSEEVENPYLPFWHVWKPATVWSKSKWDRGSATGISQQPPEYFVAVINARDVPLPTVHQLESVFEQLPEEPKGPTKKLGPQYQKQPPRTRPPGLKDEPDKSSLFGRLWALFDPRSSTPTPRNGSMGALRNGDRALVVAVNDSGNTGWVRFGRSDFSPAPVVF